MRNFIISIVCLGLLVGVWVVFDQYSNKKLHEYADTIDNHIMKDMEDGKWHAAYNEFLAFSDDWHQYKKYAAFFLDTQTINDADYAIAKTKYYMKAKDDSNAPGELSSLKEQLVFLHYNESLAIGNIF